MPEELTALIGFHEDNPFFLKSLLGRRGYVRIDTVASLREMIETYQAQEYQAVIMDVNLGAPGSPSAEPAQRVYNLLRERFEGGLMKFYPISGTQAAVDAAIELGMPAMGKREFKGRFDQEFGSPI
jgi:CheY-like chemotaxis protein|tara:strand:- start:1087 stop:1464 length:378 start_codon:yes stop_codon:yes gene_type:complete